MEVPVQAARAWRARPPSGRCAFTTGSEFYLWVGNHLAMAVCDVTPVRLRETSSPKIADDCRQDKKVVREAKNILTTLSRIKSPE
jgi:hypothetical protein